MKTCSRCKSEKPISAFCRDKTRPDGLKYWCSDCRNVRHQEIVSSRTVVIPESTTCTSCKVEKSASSFSKDRGTKNGLSSWCRECYGTYWKENREQGIARQQRYRAENPDVCAEATKDWHRRNPDYRPNYAHNYRAEKPWVQATLNANYRAALKNATPVWADQKAIAAFYEQAARLTKETGIEHHVDHIYPLQSDVMCGLHVPANLQVIPAKLNIAKSNRIADVEKAPLCCAWPNFQLMLSSVEVQ